MRDTSHNHTVTSSNACTHPYGEIPSYGNLWRCTDRRRRSTWPPHLSSVCLALIEDIDCSQSALRLNLNSKRWPSLIVLAQHASRRELAAVAFRRAAGERGQMPLTWFPAPAASPCQPSLASDLVMIAYHNSNENRIRVSLCVSSTRIGQSH